MKKITEQAITGQRGVALIEDVVLQMGCVWYPTGGLEAGIDGFIEFTNPNTREALNAHVAVQSRATKEEFAAETPTSFEYLCSEKDLAYWLTGNQPVVFIR